MFDWFMNDGFPELVILDHEMVVFDTPENFDFDYLNDKIQDALDFCDPCGNSGLLGDVNFDGEVNILDVVIIVNDILGPGEWTDEEFWAADYNQDGSIDVLDIVSIVTYILGE